MRLNAMHAGSKCQCNIANRSAGKASIIVINSLVSRVLRSFIDKSNIAMLIPTTDQIGSCICTLYFTWD